MKTKTVKPLKPDFYRRFVDDVIHKRLKGVPDTLLDSLNNYHPKINFTVEVNPSKFLDTKLIERNGRYTTEVYRKPSKLPVPWSSNTPKRYKRNTINGDLYRSYRIATKFEDEKVKIREKYLAADYPPRFIESVIKQFESRQNDTTQDDYFIPPNFFDTPKPQLWIELPFCYTNENTVKRFIFKFNQFTDHKYDIRILWKTKKVRQLFPLKDRNPYPSCKIYEGKCVCGASYVGETKRNVHVRWNEHNHPLGKSEPARHLRSNIDHVFDWKVLMSAPTKKGTRRNLEAFLIALKRPSLNEQVNAHKLVLFRNGVT